ncbi:MAG: hypothetical protein GY950_15155 [bacterium]|nr:hypothetical protein [bacterium]
MSSREDYDLKLETIKAIEDNQIKIPHHIPVDVYIQEAKNLYQWARADLEALTAAGLSPELVEDLPIRLGALSKAEALWYVRHTSGSEAAHQWAAQLPPAVDLRKQLLHDFRFAFRKHPDLSAALGGIGKGRSFAALIQDLSDLGVIGESNRELLAVIAFDMSLIDRAAQVADEMSRLLAQRTTDRLRYNEAKKIRDQAYTHLKGAVDDIREYGRFVFRRDKERLSGYRSHYMREKKKKKAANPKPNPVEDKENVRKR